MQFYTCNIPLESMFNLLMLCKEIVIYEFQVQKAVIKWQKIKVKQNP